MDALFMKIVNMSITASWLVLAVVILRLLLKKAPRAISCALWIIVALRLIMPFSFESAFSLVPSTETIPSDFTSAEKPAIDSGIYEVDEIINPFISDILAKPVVTPMEPDKLPDSSGGTVEAPEKVPQTPDNDINEPSAATETPAKSLASTLAIVWAVGVFGMLVYMLASYLRIRLRVREAVSDGDGIMICDSISSPFIFGVVRPRIYLPSSLNETDREYVLAHERAHLSRLDHLWKPLGFILLAVHWFNPLLWLAYVLLCRDVELACDESVIRKMGAQIKKPYSEALVNCSMPRRMIAACPLAFGEVGVKGRIKAVLNYKKPAFWIIIVAVIAVIVTSICFLTDPLKPKADDKNSPSDPSDTETVTTEVEMTDELRAIFEETVKKELRTENYRANQSVVGYTVLKVEENINDVTVYAVVMYREYNTGLYIQTTHCEYESHEPIKVMFSKQDDGLALITCKRAENGEKYPKGFPESLKSFADPQKYEEKHSEICERRAKYAFGIVYGDCGYEWELARRINWGMTQEVRDTSLTDTHFPMHIMKTLDDVRAYYTMMKVMLISGSNKSPVDEAVEEFSKVYPAEFFEENSLIFIYFTTSSGGDQFAVESVENDGKKLTVNLIQTGFGGTEDLGRKLIIITVPKADIESCTEFAYTASVASMHSELYVPENTEDADNAASVKLYVYDTLVGQNKFFINGFNIRGEYEHKDGYLYLYSYDGQYVYAFKDLERNRYEFDARKSTANWGKYEIEHGQVFVLYSVDGRFVG